MFKPVSAKVDFPQLEKKILGFWKERRIPERSVEERRGGPQYLLYEGPPTANASPGIHHVLSRVFKDIMPRYKTMKGYCAPRKAGWDTHGLPVELEVEKQLGFTSKADIERYGIAEFNAVCKKNVMRYVKEWEDLTDRIGFWIDMAHPYVTYENNYIETIWWILKELWGRDMIHQAYKSIWHCPRCVTSLSDHEVALGYNDNTQDVAITVKFKIDPGAEGGPAKAGELIASSPLPTYILAWTTTPWTLPGNTALALDPEAEYVLVEDAADGAVPERLILARGLAEKFLPEGYQVVGILRGKELVGIRYQALYNPVAYKVPSLGKFVEGFVRRDEEFTPEQTDGFRVIGADFVSLDEGTGVVHMAPAFGEDDFKAGAAQDLFFVQHVDLQGKVLGDFPFAGKFVKDADAQIIDDLAARQLLFRQTTIRHTYPFCWRCDSPLIYYAKSTWYIKTTAIRDTLLEGNDKINWYPEHIKNGRFGGWLKNVQDWAISRERYWGTPIPFWRCDSCERYECIGSVEELRARPEVRGIPEPLDLHRPYVDQVHFRCAECGGTMTRIPEVIDVWFESGAMPLAQWHYPFENSTLMEDGRFPADYICEAVDQTRGWFYSLHAISSLLFGVPCFDNVICLGHILDGAGEKMSKRKGNVVDPWSVLNVRGADALRWYLYTASPPGNSRRFSDDLVGEVLRKFMLTLWNTYSFFVTYALIDGYVPGDVEEAPPTSDLDRWLLSELNRLVLEVTRALDGYDPTDAGRRIEAFVENLSNWYVRRSRRRFWKSENDQDKLSAYSTLYRCLVTLSKLLAPFMPFLSEEMYRNLVCSVDDAAPESVHLARFPEADPGLIDDRLNEETRLVMKISSLGRAARSKAGIKVRQPLPSVRVKVRDPGEQEAIRRLFDQVGEELNVKSLAFVESEAELVEYRVSPNTRLLGPKYGKGLPGIARGLAALDTWAVARSVQAGEEVQVGQHRLLPEEINLVVGDKAGLSTVVDGDYVVAVDTDIPEELATEGMAREIVHRLQMMRRSAGFQVTDHIITYIKAQGLPRKAVEAFDAYIKEETLSHEIVEGDPPEEAFAESHQLDGLEVVMGVVKVDT
ncbi:MAG: isoleucine--tRNA ligase [Chloroflexi bacterium]|nr:isoleucine--tRNA ligase [Chloroflexota bacterium]